MPAPARAPLRDDSRGGNAQPLTVRFADFLPGAGEGGPIPAAAAIVAAVENALEPFGSG
jgi:hypothetical protein